MEKMIQVEDNGYVWRFPLKIVARNRAAYYEQRDEDTTFQEEYDLVMGDEFEGIDWFQNNMDWEDVSDHAVLVMRPDEQAGPDMSSADLSIVEVSA